MDRFADLHTHTRHSDGLYEPRDLVDRAVAAGLSILCISDHDNLTASRETAPYARSLGIVLISGTELSCQHAGVDVHVLAYGVDLEDSALESRLASFRKTRDTRGEIMVDRLRELGYPVSIDRVREIAGDGALGRPHVARALVEMGAVDSLDTAFRKFLGDGRPAFVDKERFRIDEVVDLVRNAGGVTSVAHPSVYRDHRHLVNELIDAGIDGIETHHPDVDATQHDYYERLARDRGLFVTGGSDDHGNGGPKTIGQILVPESSIRALLDRIDA